MLAYCLRLYTRSLFTCDILQLEIKAVGVRDSWEEYSFKPFHLDLLIRKWNILDSIEVEWTHLEKPPIYHKYMSFHNLPQKHCQEQEKNIYIIPDKHYLELGRSS